MNMTIMSYQQQNDYSGPQQGANNTHHGLGSSGNKLLVSSATIASSSDDAIKSQFQTREGTYKLMTLSEFSRPSRVPLNPHQGQNVACNAPVRVSFVNLPESCNSLIARDYICFNVGRELYVYSYGGVSKVTDLSRPIDKRVYKGTFPTCHDFNRFGASSDSCPLLIGFSAGQIQLIDPFKKDSQQMSKLFNEERLTDKTRITCVKWIPSSANQFLVSHSSGFMYVYNEELNSALTVPVYQLFKQGDGFLVHTCKTKSSRNPVYRWSVGDGSVNEFAFSADGALLATAGQDGFLRIFNYHAMECVGIMRSYFGGLLCLAWSPDMRYVASGGEDDLISVYSVPEKRLICRCQGHKSWVSQVAFDPYTTLVHGASDSHLDSEEDLRSLNISSGGGPNFVSPSTSSSFPYYRQQRIANSFRGSSVPVQRRAHKESINSNTSTSMLVAPCLSYRLGSVGHDTMLCLWDLNEDILKPLSTGRLRTSALFLHSPLSSDTNVNASMSKNSKNDENSSSTAAGSTKQSGLKLKKHFMNFRGLGTQKDSDGIAFNLSTATGSDHRRDASKMGNSPTSKANSPQCLVAQNATPSTNNNNNINSKCLGTLLCPHLSDTPIVEPLINKKISHERLTVLIFREDCVVTACQEGFICTWARPGRLGAQMKHSHSVNSPNPGGSPRISSTGTVV
uniref:WD_REPEATS_REGION domain-containing protein n=1 Tax=Romanomermis culicivorax TaxID=13658 RepID=A0A915IZR8_ROMCU